MLDPAAFDYERLRYIETRAPDDKRPKHTWGGYSQDFDAANHVYKHADLERIPHGNWAVVDVEDLDHGSLALLVFDLDIHKAPADFDPDDIRTRGDTLVVRSQNGGIHVYFVVHAERGDLNEADFQMTADLGWNIDIRGSAVGAHVVAPSSIPGVDTSYEVVNDDTIAAVFDPADAVEHIQYDGAPLLEYDPASRGIEDLEFDRETEPPRDFPTCYHRGLELRAANPDHHPNTHKVNVLTALCGLYAGYDVESVVDHFVDEFPPGNPDRSKTEYQVQHLADKVDRGDYSPPSISSLRSHGILGEEESCDCSIRYHGDNEDGDALPPAEVWEWWSEKREAGDLDETSIIPLSALRHIACKEDLYDFDALPEDVDELPVKAYNRALRWVENRWWDVDGEMAARATAREERQPKPEEAHTWEDVRFAYSASKSDGRLAAVQLLREKHEFLTPQDTDDLHVYDEDLGIFDQTAKYLIGRDLDQNLGRSYSRHEKREIIGRLKEHTVGREVLEGRQFDANLICVKNGVLDVDAAALHPHDPKYKFTTYLPVEYDPSAAPEAILRFLRSTTKRNADARTLLEVLGHTLLTDHNAEWKHLFLVLFGEGSNGKSTWFEVVRTFLNGPNKESRNVESLTLQQITDNRFAASNLVGTWANIGEDLPQKKINNLGKLKDLTGGGETWVEPKGEDGFNFQNRATMMFAANRPPVLGERSTAVKRRLVPVHLPYEFTADPDPDDPTQKQAASNLVTELTTTEELSGLLNAALAALMRMREQQDVSLPESREERLELYERHSDHIKAFRVDSLANEPGEQVSKADIYNAYTNFCNENDYTKVAKSTFWRQLRQTTLNVTEKRLPKQADGSRPRVLDGVAFKEDGLRYAPGGVRDEQGAEGAAEAAGEESDGADNTAREGVPLATVTDAYAGPGSVSVRVTITNTLKPKPWLQAEGTVADDSATLDFEARGDSNPLPANAEGEECIIRNVRLTEGEYGEPKLEFRPDTEFVAVSLTPDDQQTVTQTVADGGAGRADQRSAEAWEPPADVEGRQADAKRVVAALVAAEEDALDVDNLKLAVFDRYSDQLNGKPDRVDAAIEAAISEYGWLVEDAGEIREA